MTAAHTWNFFPAGGFDQVQIDSGADLLALKDLNQKLWVALSCPTRGIEFDSKTLDMIDSDGDGRVRANEVLAAIAWAGSLLKDADVLVSGTDCLALHDIDDSTQEGQHVLASVRHILKSLGKADALEITLEDMQDIEKFLLALRYNGDGVIAAKQVEDAAACATLEDIIKCKGSAADLSGEVGVNEALTLVFFDELRGYADWSAASAKDAAILPLGEGTSAAAAALAAVRDKVEDYFTRCQLAAYDARAAEPLSRAVADYQQFAAQNLSAQNAEVGNFPLATVAAGKALPLDGTLNPVWQSRIETLNVQVLRPLLGDKSSLSAADWQTVCGKFSAYFAWQAAKPANAVEPLGMKRITEILSSSHEAAINDLIKQDKSVEAEVKSIHSVEKLLRYKRDLYLLVNNFVSFRHFYRGKDKGIFQVGTLYLDRRSCELCVRVEDVAKHASFASLSGMCLVYCECTRKTGGGKMNIAAAFTAGDADFLMVGRNGIFYDRQGNDWDANVVRIIDNPISLRQAFWSPYKKVVKAISEQIQKLAASKASAVDSNLQSAVVDQSKAVAAPAAASAKPAFDVAKFAGIFAAIGLAIGAIGGILASVMSGLLSLKFWQIPIALVGVMLMISLPAVALAWFKLKNRNLAPILDANGWAINARAKINIPFGTSLTGMARLPDGASRSLVDPFAEEKSLWPFYLIIALGACAVGVLWYYGFFGHA